jgi:hypothetical membrane protein
MTTMPSTSAAPTTHPRQVLTRWLLSCGIVAGPVYVATSLAQALTREGFVLYRHAWSQLAAGDRGWIQQLNLAVTGLLVAAFAHGLRRSLPAARRVRRASTLLTVFGAGMFVAAFFTADPALGFPVGTPDDYRGISWHGAGHMIAASIGFLAVTAATVTMARHFAGQHDRAWTAWSLTAGIFFLGSFVGVSGTGSSAGVIAFTVGVVTVFSWLATLAARILRERSR